MTKKSLLSVFTFVLLLLAGYAAAAGQAQEQADEEFEEGNEIPGTSLIPVGSDGREVNARIPEGNELEEIAPVTKEEIEALPDRYEKEAPIFKKYAFLPAVPGGIDHAAAGGGTRNTGYTTARLRGVPPGAVAVSAFLYWGAFQASAPVTQTVTFQGSPVTGTLIGTAANSCWGGAGLFAAYRAYVLTLLVPGINGDYSVVLPSALTNGQDALNPVNFTLPMSEGATLVVLYSHSSVPADSIVDIQHVVQLFSTTLTTTHFLTYPVNHNGLGDMKHTRFGADGQAGAGYIHVLTGTDERTSIGTFMGPLTQIKGNGAVNAFSNADSDWNGYDGEPLNQLWDTHSMYLPSGSLALGTTIYQVSYTSNGDCIYPVGHVLTSRF